MTELENFISQQQGKTISVAVHDLETGQEILVNPDESYNPASTIKVHVMMEVFHQAEQGIFSLEDCIPIINSFKSIVDGSEFSLDVNDDAEQTLYPRVSEEETIAELTRLMIVHSSNLATNILLEAVGIKNINEFMQVLGIQGVNVIRGVYDMKAFHKGMYNSATARGLTQSMRLLAAKNVVSPQASERMIEILLGQEFNESIPALLPASTKVAHKTGWTGDVYHDTGIVCPEGRKPYAISIMTRGFSEDQEKKAHTCMAEISKIVYESLAMPF